MKEGKKTTDRKTCYLNYWRNSVPDSAATLVGIKQSRKI
ncbi:hypothetical protein EC2872000_1758 [Escherichia coli 2872000]|jgi:hypothetical protein|nr:hypothetical protein EC2872000_1758 [Escherichia coli 2872000]ENB28666.1 hypothetical protein ECBCE030MS09_1628 [Escherichia coli BCE030_MS-09]